MSRSKTFSLYSMAMVYFIAGVLHFIKPHVYEQLMPAWLPAHSLLIFLSGVAEVVIALLLLPAATRRTAAWLLILLLIAIFPANIQYAVNFYKQDNPWLWLALLRLPIQFILIWWAWLFTFDKKRSLNTSK